MGAQTHTPSDWLTTAGRRSGFSLWQLEPINRLFQWNIFLEKKKWCAKSVFAHTSNYLKLFSFTDAKQENVCAFPVPCPVALAPCLLQSTLKAGPLNSSTCTRVSCLCSRVSLQSLELGMPMSHWVSLRCWRPGFQILFWMKQEEDSNLSLLLSW